MAKLWVSLYRHISMHFLHVKSYWPFIWCLRWHLLQSFPNPLSIVNILQLTMPWYFCDGRPFLLAIARLLDTKFLYSYIYCPLLAPGNPRILSWPCIPFLATGQDVYIHYTCDALNFLVDMDTNTLYPSILLPIALLNDLDVWFNISGPSFGVLMIPILSIAGSEIIDLLLHIHSL